MYKNIKLAGHPLHTQLVGLPIGLLTGAVIFDVVHLYSGNEIWATITFAVMGLGILGGLIAAPFGWLDWLAIPKNTRAKYIGLLHGVGNIVMLIMFLASWVLRGEFSPASKPMSHILSFAGLLLMILTGWLGGELVDRMGIGVDEGAHANSPNSLSGRPASEQAPSSGFLGEQKDVAA
jgi:uncharacterized membrane protein